MAASGKRNVPPVSGDLTEFPGSSCELSGGCLRSFCVHDRVIYKQSLPPLRAVAQLLFPFLHWLHCQGPRDGSLEPPSRHCWGGRG